MPPKKAVFPSTISILRWVLKLIKGREIGIFGGRNFTKLTFFNFLNILPSFELYLELPTASIKI